MIDPYHHFWRLRSGASRVGSALGALLATAWLVGAHLWGKFNAGNEDVGVLVGSSRIGTGAAD